jgi:hypothetical protein
MTRRPPGAVRGWLAKPRTNVPSVFHPAQHEARRDGRFLAQLRRIGGGWTSERGVVTARHTGERARRPRRPVRASRHQSADTRGARYGPHAAQPPSVYRCGGGGPSANPLVLKRRVELTDTVSRVQPRHPIRRRVPLAGAAGRAEDEIAPRARREILHAAPKSQLKLRPRSRERRLCGEGRRQPTPVGGSSPPSFPGDEPPSLPGKLFLATSSPGSWRRRASNLAATPSPRGVRQGAVPETRPRRTREVAYPLPSAPRWTRAR